MYGGTKAFMNRWTASLAAELYGEGVAANALAPEAAAATEVLVEYSNLADELYEPLETMAEASFALCSSDPAVLTGRVVTSLELLVELDRPVLGLDGGELMEGWQPGTSRPRSRSCGRTRAVNVRLPPRTSIRSWKDASARSERATLAETTVEH